VFTLADLMERSKPFNLKGRLYLFAQMLKCSGGLPVKLAKNGGALAMKIGVLEDVLFGHYLPSHQKWFKVPNYEQAAAFCIDRHVKQELSARGGELPFGTHAWWTSPDNLAAWMPYILEVEGNS
jgi:hypothetical protein